jgi:hypothetical protein
MRIERASLAACVTISLALTLLIGCPGKLSNKQSFLDYAAAHPGFGGDEADSPDNEPTAGTAGTASSGACGDVVTRIFVPTCGGTGCHSASASQQGLDLVSPDVASRVVGVSAKVCSSTLANPQNPEASLMYQKLLPLPKCGAQMPLARPPLSSADAACVLAWIAAQPAAP